MVALLTNDQRQRVEENIKLVFWTIKKYLSSLIGDDDVFQEGYLGLCKAAENFDESRGFNFSTYAVRCILNQIYLRGRDVKKDTEQDFICEFQIDDDKFDILEAIPAKNNTEETALANVTILEVFRNLKGNQKRAVRYLANGLTQVQISVEIGVGQAQISRYIKNFRKQAVNFM